MKRIDLTTIIEPVEIILPGGSRLVCHPLDNQQNSHSAIQLNRLRELLEQFIQHLRVDRGLGVTVHDRAQQLNQFIRWLEENGIEVATSSHFYDYYNRLSQSGLSNSRVRNVFYGLKQFAQFLLQHGHLNKNPLDSIKPPKLHSSNVQTRAITPDNIKKMFASAGSLRDRAMLALFLDTGIRASEAAKLNWSDIDLETGDVFINSGKYGKSRRVPIGDETVHLLTQHRRALQPEPDDPVWQNERTGRRLTYDGIRQVFNRIARRAGLAGQPTSPHAWRHAFSVQATASGMPTVVLQQILGHSSVKTTQIYASAEYDVIKNAHRRYSPAGRFFVALSGHFDRMGEPC